MSELGDAGFHFEASDGEEWTATPENATLYLFAGELATHDHVFIETGYDADTMRHIGTYIFLFTQDADTVEEIKDYMFSNGYEAHINLRALQDCDRQAYESLIEQRVKEAREQIDDYLPGDWT